MAVVEAAAALNGGSVLGGALIGAGTPSMAPAPASAALIEPALPAAATMTKG